MTCVRIQSGDITLTCVRLTDVLVPGHLVGLSAAQIAAIPWALPAFAEHDQVKVGIAIWVMETASRRLVFDPMQAADSFLRADPDTEISVQAQVQTLLTEAGYPPATIDTVVLTHIDNVGMVARRDQDTWSPFFPNARILISEQELCAFTTATTATTDPSEQDASTALVHEAYSALLDLGCIATYADGELLAPGLKAEVSGGHQPGHAVLHLTSTRQARCISFIGHLAVSPLHLTTGPCAQLNEEPERAHNLLLALAQEGRTLIGPLWPSPGYGRWNGKYFEAGT